MKWGPGQTSTSSTVALNFESSFSNASPKVMDHSRLMRWCNSSFTWPCPNWWQPVWKVRQAKACAQELTLRYSYFLLHKLGSVRPVKQQIKLKWPHYYYCHSHWTPFKFACLQWLSGGGFAGIVVPVVTLLEVTRSVCTGLVCSLPVPVPNETID